MSFHDQLQLVYTYTRWINAIVNCTLSSLFTGELRPLHSCDNSLESSHMALEKVQQPSFDIRYVVLYMSLFGRWKIKNINSLADSNICATYTGSSTCGLHIKSQQMILSWNLFFSFPWVSFCSSETWLKRSHWHEWEIDLKTMSANGSWEQGWLMDDFF